MQKTENRIPKKGHHVSSLLSTGGHRRPKPFVPLVAHVASCVVSSLKPLRKEEFM